MRKLFSSKTGSPPEGELAHQGWLQKRGQVNTDFKRRYFTLHGTCLTYYESEDAAAKHKAKGQVTVAAVTHVRPEDAPELSTEQVLVTFRFTSKDKKTVLYMLRPLKRSLLGLVPSVTPCR